MGKTRYFALLLLPFLMCGCNRNGNSNSQSDFASWSKSPDAADYNGDRKITEDDYYLSKLVGTYEIQNFVIEEQNCKLVLLHDDLKLSDMSSYTKDFSLKYSLDGIDVLYSSNISSILSEETVEEIKSVLESAELTALNDNLFTLEIPISIDKTNVDLYFYFTKTDIKNLWQSKCSFSFTSNLGNCKVDMSFNLKKIG